ncbi:MAG: NUDIX hydrolase [Candidatus Doudnabacteria bacterium]|nr:NUDIX hydrolase [Candidatus Doudnabacteria bacterium]
MAIPKKAKKVFKGIIFDVYQWPQKMFDGSVATFERLVRKNSVVIIPTVGDKIAIVKQQQPSTGWFYDLPSGRMDIVGESPRHAALRELLEETGLKPRQLVLWKIYQPSGKIVHKVYYYIAEGCQRVSAQKLDSGERIEVIYKTLEEFLKLTDNPRCFLGPLNADILLARIHKENRHYLFKAFFKPTQLPKAPKFGPKTNW